MRNWIKKLISLFGGEEEKGECFQTSKFKGDWCKEWQWSLKLILNKRSKDVEDYVSKNGIYFNLTHKDDRPHKGDTICQTYDGNVIMNRWESLNLFEPLCSNGEAITIPMHELKRREEGIFRQVKNKIVEIIDNDIRYQLLSKCDSLYICDSTKSSKDRYSKQCEFLPDSPMSIRAIQNICVKRKEEIGGRENCFFDKYRTNYGTLVMGEEQSKMIFPEGLSSCRDGIVLSKEKQPLRFDRPTSDNNPDFIEPDKGKEYELAKYEVAFLFVGNPLTRCQRRVVIPCECIYIKKDPVTGDYNIHYVIERNFIFNDMRLCIPIAFQRLNDDMLGFWKKLASRDVLDKESLGFKEFSEK